MVLIVYIAVPFSCDKTMISKKKYTLFHSVLQPLIVHLSACLQRRNPIYKVYAVEQQKGKTMKCCDMRELRKKNFETCRRS